jgi:hypothetical protein
MPWVLRPPPCSLLLLVLLEVLPLELLLLLLPVYASVWRRYMSVCCSRMFCSQSHLSSSNAAMRRALRSAGPNAENVDDNNDDDDDGRIRLALPPPPPPSPREKGARHICTP